MKILLGFFIFVLGLTILEIFCISMLADLIGNIWYTIAIIFLTGIFGFFIAKKNAKEALKNLLKGDFRSTPPVRQIFDTIAFFFAAAFLIIPGLITDVLGILLLLPIIRNIIYRKVSKGKVVQQTENAFRKQNFDSSRTNDSTLGSDGVIDIEAEDV